MRADEESRIQMGTRRSSRMCVCELSVTENQQIEAWGPEGHGRGPWRQPPGAPLPGKKGGKEMHHNGARIGNVRVRKKDQKESPMTT